MALALLAAACDGGTSVTSQAAEVATSSTEASAATSVEPTTTTLVPTTEPPATTVAESPDPPYFETGECVTEAAVEVAAVSGRDVECGHLVVLENRAEPAGTQVRLPVMIARTRNPNAEPDPLIYLAGGGGHNHLRYANFLTDSVGDAVLEQRDFIQYNQRGAPLTTPELSCPGLTEFLFGLAGESIDQQEWSERHIAFVTACRDALVDDGIDLSMYNSAVNAADADDLRIALGYEQANYYGTSYGTRLGLDLIRDYPAGVRSIILDSVYPPQFGYYTESGANLERAFNYLFESCAADEKCNSAYPDLAADFYNTIEQLDREPRLTETSGSQVLMDGGLFMDAASLYLYSPDNIPRVPDAIAKAARGDFTAIRGPLSGAITSTDINWVMFYEMQCREEVPFESLDDALRVGATLDAGVAAHYIEGFARFHFDLCEQWEPAAADSIEALAVEAEVPTLVLAGSYDPVTPPSWGESTAQALPNAFFYEFAHIGHGVMRSTECGLSIGLQFLDDPNTAPETSCIAEMAPPDFS